MRVLLPWGGHCSTNSSDCDDDDESSSSDSDSSSCSVSSSTTGEEVDDDDQDHEEVVHNPSSSFAEQAPPLPADRDHSTLLAPVSHSQESSDGLVVLAEEEEGRQDKEAERLTLPSTLEDPSSPRPPRSETKAPSSDQVLSAPSSASFDSIDQPGKSPPPGKKVTAKRKSELHTLLAGSHQYFPSHHQDLSAGGAFPLEESSSGTPYKKRLRSSDVKKPPAVAAAELPLKPPSTAIMVIAGRFKSDSDNEGEPQPQGDDEYDDEALLLLENTPARIWIQSSSSAAGGSMVVAENDPPPAWNSDGPIGGTAQYHHHHHGGVASLNHPAMMMMSSHTKNNNNNDTASSSSFLERKRPPPCLEAFQDKLKQQGLEMVEQEGDGNCLFRAVSLQVYGTADSHGELRERVMDFMARNEEHYSSFVDGNFRDYILRKRGGGVHGNHAEIQAISELYNRPVEVYQDDGTPMNIFHQEYKTADPPIRLSYHDGNHYNAVIDPLVPTAGLGLGLPGLQPGLADQLQITKAKTESDQLADQMELDRIIQESKADFKDSQDDELQRVLKESSMDYMYKQKSMAFSDFDATNYELEQKALSASLAESSSSLKRPGRNKQRSIRRRPSPVGGVSHNNNTGNAAPSPPANLAPPPAFASIPAAASMPSREDETASPTPFLAPAEYPQVVQELAMNGFELSRVVHAYELIGDNFDDLLTFLLSNNNGSGSTSTTTTTNTTP